MTRAVLALLLLAALARADDLDDLRSRRDAAIASVASSQDARGFDAVAADLEAWIGAATRALGDPPEPEAERRRDRAELLLADGHARVARLLPDGPERRTRLERALAGYEVQVDDRGTWPDLLDEAYFGRIDVNHDLGRYDDAVSDALSITSCFLPPFEPRSPEERRLLQERMERTMLRGHRALLRALLALDRPDEALSLQAELERRVPRWRDHELAPPVLAERARALALVGRADEGARELLAAVERGRAAKDELPGLDLDRAGALACVALADLEASTDEPLPPAALEAAALGHDLRGRAVQALGAWKRVIASARTPEERARAADQVGRRLWVQERYLEAALAWELGIVTTPGGDQEVLRLALAAAARNLRHFDEDLAAAGGPMATLYLRLAAYASSADEGGPRPDTAMQRAQELQAKGEHAAAAAAYLQVPTEIGPAGERRANPQRAKALVGAGQCLLAAGSADELARAREHLAAGVALAQALDDGATLRLGQVLLGQLENVAGRPEDALRALAPFDDAPPSTAQLARARHQQALAHLALGDPAKAEAAYASVADQADDAALRRFAWDLAAAFHRRAQAAPDVAATRAERARAGRYAEAFLALNTTELRPPVLPYLAHLLAGGGRWEAAARVADELLRRVPRPRLDGRPESAELDDDLDAAERTLGWALVLTGRAREGWDRLVAVRDTVHLLDRDGRRVGRGRLVRRELRGPFERRVDGRPVAEQRWFTVVAIDRRTASQATKPADAAAARAFTDERAFFDVVPPADGAVETRAVEGRDPTAPWLPAQERRLVRPFVHDLLVADGLARAAWARWEAERDRAFLAGEVTAASNHLRWLLRGTTERGWAAHASAVLVDLPDRFDASWQADLRYLRIKLAREAWREVASDIALMKMNLHKSPRHAEQLADLEAIRAEAEARAR